MHRRAVFLPLVVVVLLAGTVNGQKSPRDVTVEDYFSLASVTDLALSRDGRHVAYCESRWQESSDDRKADLWVVSLDPKDERGPKPVLSPAARRLTGDRANERHPRWATGRSIFALA